MGFRKKPVVIEAIQWLGKDTLDDVKSFLGNDFICWWVNHGTIGIKTLEGHVTANKGDWIIRGIKGEHYACKPDIFEQTYELVE